MPALITKLRQDCEYQFTIHHVPGGDDLPRIKKPYPSLHWYRRLYATFAVDDGECRRCNLQEETRIGFTARPGSLLRIALNAEHHFSDKCVARKTCSLTSLLSATQPLFLIPCHDSVDKAPQLALKVTVLLPSPAAEIGDADLATKFTLNQNWTTIERYVQAFLEVSSIVAGIHPVGQAVVSILQRGFIEYQTRIERNDNVVAMINEMRQALQVTHDLEDTRFERQREKQMEACRELLIQVYRCLALVNSLSAVGLAHRTSEHVAKRVTEMRQNLQKYTREVEKKGQFDMQIAVFRVENMAQELVDDMKLRYLPAAQGVQPNTAMLRNFAGAHEDLLSDIEKWAFLPDARRRFILSGAEGRGKSTIANAVALRLKAAGAHTGFFAFDRGVPDRQASQVLPTLALHLAPHNKLYHEKLCGLGVDSLSSQDMTDQCGHLIINALHDDASLMPIVFVIDALDECPAGEERSILLEKLWECMLDERLPQNIRFFITTRSDSTDIKAYTAKFSLFCGTLKLLR